MNSFPRRNKNQLSSSADRKDSKGCGSGDLVESILSAFDTAIEKTEADVVLWSPLMIRSGIDILSDCFFSLRYGLANFQAKNKKTYNLANDTQVAAFLASFSGNSSCFHWKLK